MNPEDIFEAIEKLQNNTGIKAVFGEPITIENKTVIPVTNVMYGFGFGYNQKAETEVPAQNETDSGTGGGGGIAGSSSPRAVVEITSDHVRVIPIMDESIIALTGIFTGIWAIFWSAITLKAIFGKK